MDDTTPELQAQIIAALQFRYTYFVGRSKGFVFSYPGQPSVEDKLRMIHTLKSEVELRSEIDQVIPQRPFSAYRPGTYYPETEIEQTGYLDALEYCLRYAYLESLPHTILPGLLHPPKTFSQWFHHERYYSGGRGGAYLLAVEENINRVELRSQLDWYQEHIAEAKNAMRLGMSPRFWGEGFVAEVPIVIDLIERMLRYESFPMLISDTPA